VPVTDHQLNQSLFLPDVPTQNRPATDSSRVLLGLMELASAAAADVEGHHALEGVVTPEVLRRLLATLHFRDVNTVVHSRRVAQLAIGIGEHLRWEGRHLKVLEIAALLHDIGKIGVPDNILFKPGKLNPDEAQLMSLHHYVGVDVVQACRVDHEVGEIIIQSRDFTHDGYSSRYRSIGSGHLGARILSVADAYDALRCEQVYRRAKSHDETLKILVEGAGRRFDGNVVAALSRWTTSCGLAQSTDYQSDNRPQSAGPTFGDAREAQEADRLCQIFSYLYLMENLYDGFYLVDSDLKFVVWNGGMQRLLGRGGEQVLGRAWTSRTLSYCDAAGRDLNEADLSMRQVVESGKAVAASARIRHADGRLIDVEVQTVPLMDDWGRLRGVAEIIRDASRNRMPDAEFRDLRLAASRDPLTGIANRGELELQLTQLLATSSAGPNADPACAIFIDVDHFKETNDTFGHAVGDIVLIEIARLLQQETYSGEIVGRYGGEEFVILCPETDLDQAIKRAERIRIAIASLELAELQGGSLTASFGVTQAVPGDTELSVLKRADKALYAAKNGGRNQTCFLMASDDIAAEAENEGIGNRAPGTLEFEANFHACTASELVVYKLGGFVKEVDAKLIEITAERVRLSLGRTGFFKTWGKLDERKPIELELDLSTEVPPREVNGRLVKSNQVLVQVKMRPLGIPRSPEDFDARCRQILKQLSTYFLAEL
jgi:diguanylate cyclase (GGDEF)-like protein/PAS domain S-box-containing protein/putative nucleotidyltransferase with HDIG domain